MKLEEIRVGIDSVDNQLKELFVERMKLADGVARAKSETADDIFKPDREDIIIERLTEGVSSDIVKEYTAFIKKVMEVSRKYQYGKTIELREGLTHENISETATMRIKFMCHNGHNDLGKILSMIRDYEVTITDIQVNENDYEIEIEANYAEKEIKALIYQLECETKELVIGGNTQ